MIFQEELWEKKNLHNIKKKNGFKVVLGKLKRFGRKEQKFELKMSYISMDLG